MWSPLGLRFPEHFRNTPIPAVRPRRSHPHVTFCRVTEAPVARRHGGRCACGGRGARRRHGVVGGDPRSGPGVDLEDGGPQVSRHDRVGRSGVRQELQPLHRDRPAERSVHQGLDVRAARHLPRRRPAGGSVARPQLEVVERQQDADAEPGEERQVVGRQAADLGRRRLLAQGRQRRPVEGDGHHRLHAAGLEHRLDQRERQVRRRAEAEDRRLAVHRHER